MSNVDSGFWPTVREDLAATMWPGAPRSTAFWLSVLAKLALNPRVRAVLYFRLGHLLAQHRLMPIALWLRGRALRGSGAEIHPLARIGPGLLLVHSSGVVIGPEVVIGPCCRIHQGVTLGEPARRGATSWAAPKVGERVILGAHAVILGGVTVGDGASVGANAVVTHDVAADTTVVGIPARPI